MQDWINEIVNNLFIETFIPIKFSWIDEILYTCAQYQKQTIIINFNLLLRHGLAFIYS